MIKRNQIISFIEKISTLENKFGSNAHFSTMEPIDFDPKNIVSIQNITKQIANFVGLKDLTFIVAVAKQEKNVGGHIDLITDSGKDVFIELSPNVVKHKDAVLATISHEISHKILALNEIQIAKGSPEPFYLKENEVLTDITAIYFGLGKLMLNGCECSYSSKKYLGDKIETTTHSIKTGYLTIEQFSFIYLFIFNMRNIGRKEYEYSLTKNSLSIVKECKKLYNEYFNQSFHEENNYHAMKEEFDKSLVPVQKSLASIENNLSTLKSTTMFLTDKYLNDSHEKINSMINDLIVFDKKNTINPSMRYITHLKIYFKIKSIIDEIDKMLIDSKPYGKALNKINGFIKSLKST